MDRKIQRRRRNDEGNSGGAVAALRIGDRDGQRLGSGGRGYSDDGGKRKRIVAGSHIAVGAVIEEGLGSGAANGAQISADDNSGAGGIGAGRDQHGQQGCAALDDRSRIGRSRACGIGDAHGRVARIGCAGNKIRAVVVRILEAVIAPEIGGGVGERGRGRRAFKAGCSARAGAVAGEIHNRAAHGAAAAQGNGAAHQRHLARRRAHGDIAGGVRSRQVGGPARALRFLNQKILSRRQRSAQRRDLPGSARRRSVLHGPAVEIYGNAIGVEDLDEIILEGGAGISAAAINLADHDAAAAGLYRASLGKESSDDKQKKAKGRNRRDKSFRHRQRRVSTAKKQSTNENPVKRRLSVDIAGGFPVLGQGAGYARNQARLERREARLPADCRLLLARPPVRRTARVVFSTPRRA